jgi:hypothetical protein
VVETPARGTVSYSPDATLTGLAIVVMLLLDQTVVRFVPPLRRFFS